MLKNPPCGVIMGKLVKTSKEKKHTLFGMNEKGVTEKWQLQTLVKTP